MNNGILIKKLVTTSHKKNNLTRSQVLSNVKPAMVESIVHAGCTGYLGHCVHTAGSTSMKNFLSVGFLASGFNFVHTLKRIGKEFDKLEPIIARAKSIYKNSYR